MPTLEALPPAQTSFGESHLASSSTRATYNLLVCMPRPVTMPTISPLSLMTAPPVFTVSLFGMSAEYACGKLRSVVSCVWRRSKLPPR